MIKRVIMVAVCVLACSAASAREKAARGRARCLGPGRVQCLINQRLIHQLEEGDVHVRRRAARTLEKRGAGAVSARAALERAVLADRDPEVRLGALAALDAISPDARTSIPVLIKALSDIHPPVRESACRVLGQLSNAARKAQASLERVLHRDASEQVRVCAAQVLTRIGPALRPALKALERALLNDRSTRVKTAAVAALVRLDPGAKASLATYEKALCRRDPELRRAAADAIIRLGSKRAGLVLTRSLKHRSRDCREAAVQALARIKPLPHSLFPSLRLALGDRDAGVRLVAAAAIGGVGPKAAPALSNLRDMLIKDRDARVRRAAAVAIGRVDTGSTESKRALKHAAASDADPKVREAAKRTLARFQ
jgi:HEAT repeat protein